MHLVVFVVGLAMLALLPCASDAQANASLQELRKIALVALNADRAEAGLQPLAANEVLNAAAQKHARDMLNRRYYAHISPDGETARDRFLAEGGSKYLLVGENIARCRGCPATVTTERVRDLQKGWMNSPPHRKNILNAGFDRFGFGVASADGVEYAVQTFAGPGAGGGRELTDRQAAQATLERINGAREEAGRDALTLSEPLSVALREQLAGDRASVDLNTILQSLPENDAARIDQLSLLTASCGGCGERLTDEALTQLMKRWVASGSALAPFATVLGFAARSDGEGRIEIYALFGG